MEVSYTCHDCCSPSSRCQSSIITKTTSAPHQWQANYNQLSPPLRLPLRREDLPATAKLCRQASGSKFHRCVSFGWGLGLSSTWHTLNPWSLYSGYKLGKKDGIWSRPTESGSRWQTAGSFAVDESGIIRWERIAKTADDIPDFAEALKALGVSSLR